MDQLWPLSFPRRKGEVGAVEIRVGAGWEELKMFPWPADTEIPGY